MSHPFAAEATHPEDLHRRTERFAAGDARVAVIGLGYVGRPSVAWSDKAPAGYDAAVICTDHDAVDYTALVAAVPLIVDTRNAVARRGLAGDNVVKA